MSSEVTKAATCTENGETTYTAKFDVNWAVTQTKTVEVPDALGHDWEAPAYTWDDNYTTCVAVRTCRRNPAHVETAKAIVTKNVFKPATCTEKGKTIYKAEFNELSPWAVDQKAVVEDIPALGHDWDKTEYTWNDEHTACTAKRVCKNDKTHVEEAKATVTAEVTKKATCCAVGAKTVKATFDVDWAAEQTAEVELPIDPNNHGNTHWEEVANCAVDGTLQEICDDCGKPTGNTNLHNATTHCFDENGVCTVCGMKEHEDAMKFNLHVESNENYVDANVTNDYAAVLTVTPGKVDASSVTVSAAMQNVGSLGVGDLRQHSVTVKTGLTGDPALDAWLGNAFTFTKATVHATIDGLAPITYELTGAVEGENAVITALPTSVNATREAWQALTSHVATETQAADDSYIVVSNGSSLQIMGQKLGFEKQNKDDLKLDNFNDLDSMEQMIRDSVRLYDVETSDKYQVEAYLTAGTRLAVGSSIATLKDNCTIRVSGLNAADIQNVLSDLRDAESTYAMAEIAVKFVNNVIGSANGQDIYVEMTFEAPVEKAEKFYLGVTAANADGKGKTTVDATVFDDYSFVVNAPMTEISAANADLTVRMTNVASLGVTGTREHTIEAQTGLNATPKLSTWLSNVPAFDHATVNANINGKELTYEITGDHDAVCTTVTGTTDTAAARAAWQELTSHVSAATQDQDDSYAVIVNGSYAIIANECLQFEHETGDLKLDNVNDIPALKQTIKDAVQVVSTDKNGIELFVRAGTKLALGSSVATLNDDATIVIEGITVNEKVLSEIRTAANSSTEALVKTLVELFNGAIGAVNNQTLNVTMTFAEKPVA